MKDRRKTEKTVPVLSPQGNDKWSVTRVTGDPEIEEEEVWSPVGSIALCP
jgi:hypothetical protein